MKKNSKSLDTYGLHKKGMKFKTHLILFVVLNKMDLDPLCRFDILIRQLYKLLKTLC